PIGSKPDRSSGVAGGRGGARPGGPPRGPGTAGRRDLLFLWDVLSGGVDPLEVRPVLVVLLGETPVAVVMARRVGSITVTDEVVDVPVLTPFVLLKPSFRELGLRSLTGWSFSRNSPLMSWRYSPARGSLPL